MEEDDSRQFPLIDEHWDDNSSFITKRDLSEPHAQSSRCLSNLADLQKANERFRNFIQHIAEHAHTPLRQDVLAYCSAQKKSEKCIEGSVRPETLIKKMELRIDKMLKTKKLKRNWGEEDLKILIWVVSKYADMKSIVDLEKDLNSEDWKFIASVIPGVTPEACMFKWLSIKKVTLATHNWTKQQSDLLARLVGERLKGRESCNEIREWKQISQDLYWLNQDVDKVYRNAKQCREHWTCYLSPQLKKGPWQLYEDVKLLKFIKDNKGMKKWSQIAKHFEGRTENALKNRYTLIIEKQKRLVRNKYKDELTLISEYLEKCYVDQFTANVKTQPECHEQQSLYQDQSSPKDRESSVKTPTKREQIQNYDTVESVITPVRVQKFNINDFESMSIHFFRNIQPGVIESNGRFKKIPSGIAMPKESSQSERHVSSSIKMQEGAMMKNGPFYLLPAKK